MSANRIKICIPSYKRCGHVLTLNSIPLSYRDNTFLYVRDSEYQEYYAKYHLRCNVIPLENVNNIGETRQKIVEHQLNQKIFMLDDDMQLKTTRVDFKGIVRPAAKGTLWADSDFYELIEFVNETMDAGFAHGGLHLTLFPRAAATHYPYKINLFASGAIFYDLTRIPLGLFKFNEWAVLEDQFMFLTLCNAGFDSAKIHKWLAKIYVSTSAPAAFTKGGCFESRTVDVWNNSARRLHSLFPESIMLRESDYDLAFKDDNASRLRCAPVIRERAHTKQLQERLGFYAPLQRHSNGIPPQRDIQRGVSKPRK